MNLHILFYPSQATSPRGDALPTEPLALQLEEEVQQRCAGFVQSCVEHYAELLEDGSRAEEEEPESEHDDSSEEEAPPPTAKDGKGKNKRNSKTRAKLSAEPGALLSTSIHPDANVHLVGQAPTRSMLEQEYQFMATISTFLRAIRAGAVHVKHSDVLLANYGRLGPSFDLCTKVIIDVLREEGMYNDNGDLVVEVVKKALLEVRLCRPTPPTLSRPPIVVFARHGRRRQGRGTDGRACQAAGDELPHSRCTACGRATTRESAYRPNTQGPPQGSHQARVGV